MLPGRKPLNPALTAVATLPVATAGVAATIRPYALVRPYSKNWLAVNPSGFMLPLSVATELPIPDAASVVARGSRDMAVSARLVLDNGLLQREMKRSPASKFVVESVTGAGLFVVLSLPN